MLLIAILVHVCKLVILNEHNTVDYQFVGKKNDGNSCLQTGSGHFSPIGGYHAGRDMVLILDVARFKYPPHWVPLTLLWDAMSTIDNATGQQRG